MDPYTSEETGVLKNRFGITEKEALKQLEADLSNWQMRSILENPPTPSFDLAYLCAIHKKLFGKVYEWAGELRTVNISKYDQFCPARNIPSYGNAIFAELQAEECLKGLSREKFVERITHYMSEINALHPFREGNGRTQRVFITLLAKEAGYEITWATINKRKNIEAAREAFRGNEEMLRQMIDRRTKPDERRKETYAMEL